MSWPRWIRVDKTGKRTGPGALRLQKQRLREEGGGQCVYCALPDAKFGGYLHYHIEHFRPKSKFPKLERRWRNLFYACPVCNVLKSNDWPSAASGLRYQDPSAVDYNRMFDVDLHRGVVAGRTPSARYKVERLHLNRGQLILARREEALRLRVRRARTRTLRLMARGEGASLALVLDEVLELLEMVGASSPYEAGDL